MVGGQDLVCRLHIVPEIPGTLTRPPLGPKFCWIENFVKLKKIKLEGGGVKTLGYSSLTYMKPTYQILASCYAKNISKNFGGGWVVVV